MEIRVLAKHGRGIREIARQVGVSRNTIRRYFREPEEVHYRGRTRQPGKLSAFEDYIVARLASAHPERLAASVLLRELRERGYADGYTIHKNFVAARQPPAVVDPVVRFETAPGEQIQVDWATLRQMLGRWLAALPAPARSGPARHLNEHLFSSLTTARRIIEAWRLDYNTARPHTSLGGLTQAAFATRPKQGHTENELCS